MSNHIKWGAPRKTVELIKKITARAKALGVRRDSIDIHMDLTATHLNGCPLDLKKLLNAEQFDFFHDVGGIAKNLNRETAKLENHFLPRCALKDKKGASA